MTKLESNEPKIRVWRDDSLVTNGWLLFNKQMWSRFKGKWDPSSYKTPEGLLSRAKTDTLSFPNFRELKGEEAFNFLSESCLQCSSISADTAENILGFFRPVEVRLWRDDSKRVDGWLLFDGKMWARHDKKWELAKLLKLDVLLEIAKDQPSTFPNFRELKGEEAFNFLNESLCGPTLSDEEVEKILEFFRPAKIRLWRDDSKITNGWLLFNDKMYAKSYGKWEVDSGLNVNLLLDTVRINGALFPNFRELIGKEAFDFLGGPFFSCSLPTEEISRILKFFMPKEKATIAEKMEISVEKAKKAVEDFYTTFPALFSLRKVRPPSLKMSNLQDIPKKVKEDRIKNLEQIVETQKKVIRHLKAQAAEFDKTLSKIQKNLEDSEAPFYEAMKLLKGK